MTNSRRLGQFRSLRVSKPPRLLDSESTYSPLEEPSLPAEGVGGAGPCRGSSGTPCKEEARQDIAWTAGTWGRRAASLRGPKVGRDEALGEAAHSLGPGDGQLLIGAAPSLAGSRVKKCKQVRVARWEGWGQGFPSRLGFPLARKGCSALLLRLGPNGTTCPNQQVREIGTADVGPWSSWQRHRSCGWLESWPPSQSLPQGVCVIAPGAPCRPGRTSGARAAFQNMPGGGVDSSAT